MGKKIELSKRLKLVASFVEPGAVVADVGTDHGYVPIWLVQEEVAAGGIAMDVNQGPLERAKAHIEAIKKFGPTPIHRRSFIGNFVSEGD